MERGRERGRERGMERGRERGKERGKERPIGPVSQSRREPFRAAMKTKSLDLLLWLAICALYTALLYALTGPTV